MRNRALEIAVKVRTEDDCEVLATAVLLVYGYKLRIAKKAARRAKGLIESNKMGNK